MKLNAIIFFLIIVIPVTAQNNLSITGRSNVFEEGSTVVLSSWYPYITILAYPKVQQSTVIKRGKFSLSVKCESAEFYILSVKKKNEQEITAKIFLQPGNAYIALNDSTLKNIRIYNNKAANDYILFGKQIDKIQAPPILKKLQKEYDSIRKTDQAASSILFSKIDSIEKVVLKKMASTSLKWVKNNPTSFINPYVLYYFLKSETNEDTLKKIYYHFPAKIRNNSCGKELDYFFSNLIIGVKAPDFTQADTSGIEISLSDFTGKYILINFWAAWCGPCRAEHPSLRSLYDEFKTKNLIVLGVSLDNNKKTWLNAIKHDSLPWTQLSDLKFWDNKIAKSYEIRAIPTNLLLDTKGKIIAKNLSIDMLRKELNTIFK